MDLPSLSLDGSSDNIHIAGFNGSGLGLASAARHRGAVQPLQR
ncbi:hypothetical protein M6B38_121065 [Iris pallida]|uniref:Uncharacterized protein n=1 Tax=Iris pallida TaxID=29817 RepID=A0AAX6H9T6_IRIPA|nr:hypothetical protein M6B38_121065 [Iris pallida]